MDRLLISIATYRRQEDLRRLLDSLAHSWDPQLAEILVVDNDDSPTARDVVSKHSLPIIYQHEPEPGIASARNAALRYLGPRHRGIVFVDDDEWVSDDWLSNLLAFIGTYDPDVVQGTVVSVLPDDSPGWISRGGHYQRPIISSGTTLRLAATNNTFVKMSVWESAGCPRFDTAFSRTGGSDSEFFYGLTRAGAAIVYSSEVIAYEAVPKSRLSLRWISRRLMRNGSVQVRIRQKYGEPLWGDMFLAGARAARAVLLLATGLVTHRTLPAKPYRDLMSFFGRCGALMGHRIEEYRREKK